MLQMRAPCPNAQRLSVSGRQSPFWGSTDRGVVLAFKNRDFELPHEAADRHPEIVLHHQDVLRPATVRLSQRITQPVNRLVPMGIQPLLKLVEAQPSVVDGDFNDDGLYDCLYTPGLCGLNLHGPEHAKPDF